MNILYATDGSDCAVAAGRLLASLPLPTGTRVTVLSAVPGDQWVESIVHSDTSLHVHHHGQRITHQHAEEGAALLGACGVPVVCQVGGENAAMAILDRADVEHADLIVVGSHSKSPWQQFVAGSVSTHVARHAHTSVLVVRGDRIERVVVGVDGTEASQHALAALTRLPLPASAKITLVAVVPTWTREEPLTWSVHYEKGRADDGDELEQPHDAGWVLCHAETCLRAAGLQVDGCIRRGAPAEQLIAAAADVGADLVAVGSANRSTLGRLLLGSVSARVLSHAPCSVLVARMAAVPSDALEEVSEIPKQPA
jgi:nucleotide-binding universal stress UspA family protein